jgi:hypothetical protein
MGLSAKTLSGLAGVECSEKHHVIIVERGELQVVSSQRLIHIFKLMRTAVLSSLYHGWEALAGRFTPNLSFALSRRTI